MHPTEKAFITSTGLVAFFGVMTILSDSLGLPLYMSWIFAACGGICVLFVLVFGQDLKRYYKTREPVKPGV